MVPKIFIIFWKDLLIRKNHFILTTLEIVVPIIFVILANIFIEKEGEEEEEQDVNEVSFNRFQDKQCIPNLGHFSIVYEPSTPFTDMLMSKAICYAGYRKSNVWPGKVNDNGTNFNIGVEFDLNNSNNSIPDVLNYTLYPTDTLWADLNTLWTDEGRTVPQYSFFTMHDIVPLQRAIDTSYLFMKNITASKINLKNTNYYTSSFIMKTQIVYFAVFLQLLFMLPPLLSRIIQEKYSGAKELMLMMGVKKIDIWIAKFLDAFLIQLICVSGMVTFLYVSLRKGSIVLDHNPLQLWGMIMLGLVGVIVFLFFLSCFFQKSIIAIFIIGSLYVVIYLVDDYLFMDSHTPGYALYITCLFPPTALINAVFIWMRFECFDITVNATKNALGKKDDPVLYEIFLIMLANIILYCILTWYFENIIPGKFGIPKPPHFFFKKSYWVPKKVAAVEENTLLQVPSSFEAVPSNLEAAISIKNVSKIYKSIAGAKVIAVDHVNLNFYQGEISALLGHNGAGKTTVFSMITGLTYPTSGRIIIDGYDIQKNIDKARRSLGLCPQKDMLFNDLNAMQILQFYGAIKGLKMKEAKKEASELIKKLKLNDSERTRSSKLSGGQKRKVSLAIALIGGSKVLILDEPTSGMDPEIRREIWELLLKYRGERTILLTTHFMEEADALCDRIAIMDYGKVKCYGSSLFLKSKFGKGYVLNVVLSDLEKSDKIIEYVTRSVSSSKLKAQNIRTLTFELPENKVDSFPSLLSELEKNQAKNEIVSYSINVASLEEVFLSLRSGLDNFTSADSQDHTNLDLNEEQQLIKISGFSLFFQQFWALIVKKWIVYRKSYVMLLMFLIFPTALVLTVAFLNAEQNYSSSSVQASGSKPLSYSLNLYKPSVVLYTSNSEPDLKEAFQKYINGFGGIASKETQNITKTLYQTFKENFMAYLRLLNLGVEFLEDEINIFHNLKAVHMVPVSLNLIHNFLLSYAKENSSIVTSVNAKWAQKETYISSSRMTPKCSFVDLLNYGGAHVFFYIIGPVNEKLHGSKMLQLMVTPTALYWLTHLLWDTLSFFLYIVFLYLVLGYSQSDHSMFSYPSEVLGGFLLWGIGLLLIGYMLSSLLKNLAAAFSLNIIIYILFTFVIDFFVSVRALPKKLLHFHPSGILKLGFNALEFKKKTGFIWQLVVYDLILFGLLILRDSRILNFFFHRLWSRIFTINYSLPQDVKDELVKKDEETVKGMLNGTIQSDSVLIGYKLKRWYLKRCRFQPAVRGVSFAVQKGECFGLLGVNGAGKTSTFKMLTGEIPSSGGNIYVCSKKLSNLKGKKYLFGIGYCPQFGGLIPMFNSWEMLTFFARMRGVERSYVKAQVNKWLTKMGLLEIAKKRCETYSGGNQRKLSTAVSLIGDSPLIFLDEPTTGVDPLSRRSIWNLIAEIQRSGQSVVLTSHSMDECEALCSRVAIMVKGRFRCIGETTTLKDKFGQGYSVILKISGNASPEAVTSLKNAVVSSFKECELVDEHLTTLQYKVTNKNTSAEIFNNLVNLKKRFAILESYSASAATLEQIFINFAREKV